MSFPVVLDATVPADTETPQLGAARIRALTQDLIDLFALTQGGSIAFALLNGTLGTFPAVLTNKTGAGLVAGDVVGIDATNDSAVALADTQGTLVKLAVAQGSINANALGPFVLVGRTLLNTQGACVRGHYFRKSATSKKVEDTGTAMGAAIGQPVGAVGIFMTADAAGQATGIMLANPGATISARAVVTGSRSVTTIFQNTSGSAKFISTDWLETGGFAAINMVLEIDSVTPPVTPYSRTTIQAGTYGNLSGWVLNNEYFRVRQFGGGGTPGLEEWTESS